MLTLYKLIFPDGKVFFKLRKPFDYDSQKPSDRVFAVRRCKGAYVLAIREHRGIHRAIIVKRNLNSKDGKKLMRTLISETPTELLLN